MRRWFAILVILTAAAAATSAIVVASAGASGTVITVTTNSDAVNGDVSTVPGLIANPGPDGISLREALLATNSDPGTYSIEFDAALTGSTVAATAPLPQLDGGSVTINGDIDADTRPDIVIEAPPSSTDWAFVVSSSDNVLNALDLTGWYGGVLLSPPGSYQTFVNTTITNMVITGSRDGIVHHPPGPLELHDSHNTWQHTTIASNTIHASKSGISLVLHFTVGDAFDDLTITDNQIVIDRAPGTLGTGISLNAGFWDGSDGNQFTNVVIADNTITGDPRRGVFAYSGSVGGDDNLIENLQLLRNVIDITSPRGRGIHLITGDSSTAHFDPLHTPIEYPEHNILRHVDIIDNEIRWTGDAGISLNAGYGGAAWNSVSDVDIAGNELAGIITTDSPVAGIMASAAGGGKSTDDVRRAHSNSITALRIEANSIVLQQGEVTEANPISGAIRLIGAFSWADTNAVTDITIAGNTIDSVVPAIHLMGGNADTSGNEASGVDISCNLIPSVPTLTHVVDPTVAGIHVTGGLGVGATANRVQGVTLAGNLVAGEINDLSIVVDAHGATGNSVSDVVEAETPADCDITFPTTTSTTTTSTSSTTSTTTSTSTSTTTTTIPAPPPEEYPTTVGLVDTTQGRWHLRDTAGAIRSFYFGNPGDVPVMGDWDCDGVDTPGLFRTSDAYAYLSNANRSQVADIRFFFGNPSDLPLAGDFDGDGCDTLSIYRPSEQRFYIMNELGENEGGLGAADYAFTFGNPGDKPVVGDWDGDGMDEIGLHRESTGFFYYRNTLNTGVADGEFYFGDPGDRFVAGDWGTIDGIETPAVFRPGNATFYFRHTNTPGKADSEFVWGEPGWLPVSCVLN